MYFALRWPLSSTARTFTPRASASATALAIGALVKLYGLTSSVRPLAWPSCSTIASVQPPSGENRTESIDSAWPAGHVSPGHLFPRCRDGECARRETRRHQTDPNTLFGGSYSRTHVRVLRRGPVGGFTQSSAIGMPAAIASSTSV